MEENQRIRLNVQAQTTSFKEIKELLDNLEVLNEKYEIAATISIFPQANFEEFGRQN